MANAVSPEVRVFPDLDALSRAAARQVRRAIEESVAELGRCVVALAGGSTPRRLYELLAQEHGRTIPWQHVQLFWGDERLVPPDHEASNYRLAHEALISRIPIPPENVHRIPAEELPEHAARGYERALRGFFEPASEGDRFPSFDLVLLGLGKDGHTASLFPGHPVLDESECWVRAVLDPPRAHPHPRITLTLPAINHARQAYFLVSGSGKSSAVRSVLQNRKVSQKYPAAQVRPRERLVWFLDAAAYSPDQRTEVQGR